tara:strand:+ start:2247 stop:2861 length:615 start_codon:yes stop_codon:yes gene_type:complete
MAILATLGAMAPTILGGLLGASTPGSEEIDENKIAASQQRTQGLIDENLGLSRQLRDPQSAINMQMRNLLNQNAMNQGSQISNQMQKLGSMTNMSPGQIAMQQRIGMNSAMGGVNQNFLNALQKRFSQGTGIMGQMTGLQQGLDENMGNAYLSNLNMRNQDSQNAFSGLLQGGMAGFKIGESDAFSDIFSNLFKSKTDTQGDIQ